MDVFCFIKIKGPPIKTNRGAEFHYKDHVSVESHHILFNWIGSERKY